MSVGWRRQYEEEAVFEYLKMLAILKSEKPNIAGLDETIKKARLIAIMHNAQEIVDIKTQNIVRDRIEDCRACRGKNQGRCYRELNDERKCIYQTTEIKRRFILKNYGEEAEKWIEEFIRLAEERTEAKA